mgnify:FL=1
MDMNKEYYTVSEACKLLGIHPHTLRRADQAGKLVCVRTPGGRRRVPRTEIERYRTMATPPKEE